MANIDSSTLNKNVFMQAYGQCIVADGSIALAANPTAADVLRIMRIPAGTRVTALMVGNGTLDSNGAPTLVASWGYTPVNAADLTALPAAPAYFQAAGDTTLRTAQAGKLYCNFAPITFDRDVYLTATVGTASATFAAASIYVQALGEARGTK